MFVLSRETTRAMKQIAFLQGLKVMHQVQTAHNKTK